VSVQDDLLDARVWLDKTIGVAGRAVSEYFSGAVMSCVSGCQSLSFRAFVSAVFSSHPCQKRVSNSSTSNPINRPQFASRGSLQYLAASASMLQFRSNETGGCWRPPCCPGSCHLPLQRASGPHLLYSPAVQSAGLRVKTIRDWTTRLEQTFIHSLFAQFGGAFNLPP
jgi:hypothetical protein